MNPVSRRREVPSVTAMTLLAALLWSGLHAVLAVVHLDAHARPALALASAAVALAANVAAVAPLFSADARRPGRLHALALALTAVLVSLGVQPFLTPAGLVGHANWPVSGLNVLLVALVLRRRLGSAILAASGMTAVNALSIRAAGTGTTWSAVGDAASLAASPLGWLVAATALRVLLERSEEVIRRYRNRYLAAQADAMVTRAVHEAELARRHQLRNEVLPFLRALAEGSGAIDATSRMQAVRLAATLRDDLQGRALLDDVLRGEVRAARDRGVRVTLSCDAMSARMRPQPLLEGARELLVRLLRAAPEGCAVTARVTTSSGSAVLIASDVRDPDALRLLGELVGKPTDAEHELSTSHDLFEDEVVALLALR